MTTSGSHETQERDVAVIAALGYLFPPVVPLVVLFTDMGENPELRLHAKQALIWTAGFVILLGLSIALTIWLVRVDFLAICLAPFLLLLPFVPGAIWAKHAYVGRRVRIRLVSRLAGSSGRNSSAG